MAEKVKVRIQFKVILLLASFTIISSCNVDNQITIKNISIEKDLCKNCIGSGNVFIKYNFETKHKLPTVINIFNGKKKYKFHALDNLPLEKGQYCYTHKIDNYGKINTSLNSTLVNFSNLIKFNKLEIAGFGLILVTDSDTKVLYFLDGLIVHQQDSISMNYNDIEKVSFPTRNER